MLSLTGRKSPGKILALLAVFIPLVLGSCGDGSAGGGGKSGEALELSAVQYREMVSVPGGTYLQEDTLDNSF